MKDVTEEQVERAERLVAALEEAVGEQAKNPPDPDYLDTIIAGHMQINTMKKIPFLLENLPDTKYGDTIIARLYTLTDQLEEKRLQAKARPDNKYVIDQLDTFINLLEEFVPEGSGEMVTLTVKVRSRWKEYLRRAARFHGWSMADLGGEILETNVRSYIETEEAATVDDFFAEMEGNND